MGGQAPLAVPAMALPFAAPPPRPNTALRKLQSSRGPVPVAPPGTGQGGSRCGKHPSVGGVGG